MLSSDSLARFDDCCDPGSSFLLVEPVADLRADSPDEVIPVLREAEAAARAGYWVAGFVGYESAPAFDVALTVLPCLVTSVPLARFTVYRARVPAPSLPARASLLDEQQHSRWAPGLSAAEHGTAVARIRDLIAAGITYQVNLTSQWVGGAADPTRLYARMLAAQRCRYGALLMDATLGVVSASPELFFEVIGDRIVTRPMKGTSRRGRWPAEDERLALELRASEKERAENLMIVDLIRSDLGRISAAGSVEVTDLFSVEQYPTVWQLTSSVRSRLQPGTTIEHIFAALFPSGSVTGAPKVSAMAAIAELERAPRGVYCGAIGYIEPGPKLRARFAVAIRTAVIDRVTGAATYGSGGAITWSSEAGNEWDELIQKTAVLEPDTALTGLIETMRSRPDASIHNLDFHLSRLLRSAEILGIPLDKAKLTTALGARRRAGRVRVHVGGAGELTVKVSDMPPADTGPVRLGVMNGSVSSDDATLFHKLADRSRYDRWRAQRPDLDDVILVNERGEVTETTIANLAVHRDGRWWTPQLDAGLLPGVERRRLLEAGLLAERVIRVADLTGARLAVISSLRGWRPAILIDG